MVAATDRFHCMLYVWTGVETATPKWVAHSGRYIELIGNSAYFTVKVSKLVASNRMRLQVHVLCEVLSTIVHTNVPGL